jgi:hypothetical protein
MTKALIHGLGWMQKVRRAYAARLKASGGYTLTSHNTCAGSTHFYAAINTIDSNFYLVILCSLTGPFGRTTCPQSDYRIILILVAISIAPKA